MVDKKCLLAVMAFSLVCIGLGFMMGKETAKAEIEFAFVPCMQKGF